MLVFPYQVPGIYLIPGSNYNTRSESCKLLPGINTPFICVWWFCFFRLFFMSSATSASSGGHDTFSFPVFLLCYYFRFFSFIPVWRMYVHLCRAYRIQYDDNVWHSLVCWYWMNNVVLLSVPSSFLTTELVPLSNRPGHCCGCAVNVGKKSENTPHTIHTAVDTRVHKHTNTRCACDWNKHTVNYEHW